MANILSRLFGPANLANGTSTVATVTTGHTWTIRHIRIVNNSAGSITVKLGIGGVADANLICPATPLGAGESMEFDGILVLTTAETLQANTTATGLTITGTGLDQG